MTSKSKIPSVAMQKRIMKTGEVSNADVEEYINQVGLETLRSMSVEPKDVKVYLKNVTELGNTSKKKLPSKKTVDSSDSILVVDNNGRLSKVSAEGASLNTQARAKKTTDSLIGLGSTAFNKMFPTLGKFMSFVQASFEKQDKKAKDTDASVEGYSRQVGRSSVLLTSIIEGQERTNQILRQILSVVGAANMNVAQPNNVPGPENANRTGQNQTGTNERAPSSAISPTAIAAALVAAGATGAAIGSVASGGSNSPATINSSTGQPSSPAPVISIPSPTNNNAARVAPTVSATTTTSSNAAITSARTNNPQNNSTTQATRASSDQTSNPDLRILNFKAKEIVFKADKFEYPQTAISSVGFSGGGIQASTPAPSATSIRSTGGVGGSSMATPASAANLSGLEFAPGVDQRIRPNTAEKTKEVQSAFGKKLLITSGFRDPERNARAEGAVGSKHLTGEAVDVMFRGNEQETIQLIKAASAKGIGGIGVYRPGFVHLDTGPKRVWGPNYQASSTPQWAKPALDEHMGRSSSVDATAVSARPTGQQSTPAQTQLTPIASPVPSTPSSGSAIARASTADEAANRPSSLTITAPQNSPTAPISNAPQQPSSTLIDPNDPGEVEPSDAALRYARLFGMAA